MSRNRILVVALILACAALCMAGTVRNAAALQQSLGPVSLYVQDHVTEGEAFMVTIRSPYPMPDIECLWEGRTIRTQAVRETGSGAHGFMAQVLLGVGLVSRDDPPHSELFPLTIRVRGYEEVYTFTPTILRIPGDFPVQKLSLPRKYSHLSADDLARTISERADIQAALATFTNERYWECPMRRPVPGEVSGVFGMKRFINGEPRQQHGGVDMRGKYGTSVHACWEGRVILTGEHFFAGRSVFVDHGQGVISMYFHLSDIMIREGQRVMPGEVIGRVGSSGRVTGPHLHFGLSILGAAVDPMPLMQPACGVVLPKNFEGDTP